MLLCIFFACIAACRAGLLALSPSDFQKAGDINISSIVHNAPSAVSHTSFTRVHNHHISNPSQHTQSATAAQQIVTTSTTTQAASIAMQSPVYSTTQQFHNIPAAVVNPASPTVQVVENIATAATATVKGDTPIIESLTHTPAHLTFAARPVVYQTLPEIKPVRKISFDEFVPSPRQVEYKYIQ